MQNREFEDEKKVEADPPIAKATKEMHQSSIWMHLLSLVMFGGPGVHMKRLRDMTVDKIVSKAVLARYVDRMMEEWRDVTLYGTVLLGANVSFLTIQSVDEAGSAGPLRTPSQRASYFSILASMGTIVSSFMLMGRHREVMSVSPRFTRSKVHALTIMQYTFIANRSNSRWGLESLALMYGMPFSLAIWSYVSLYFFIIPKLTGSVHRIISFFLSFAILWFDNTDYVVMGLVGSFGLLFAFFLVWAVLAPYEKHPYEFFASRAAQRVRAAGRRLGKGSVKAAKAAALRLSSAGSVSMGHEALSPPGKTKSLPASSHPPSPTHDAFGASMRPSMSSTIVQRHSMSRKHQKSWSEPSVTVEGDGNISGAAEKKSLDPGQYGGPGVVPNDEKAAWEGKAAKFGSPV